MIIDLEKLSPETKAIVLRELDDARRSEDYLMTYREAAEIYGYEYGSLRYYVCIRALKARGPKYDRRITHQAMRDFIASRSGSGRKPFGPNAQKLQQQNADAEA